MRGIARFLGPLAMAAALAGCVGPTMPAPMPPVQPSAPTADGVLSPRDAARNFVYVVERLEPVAEAVCMERAARGTNCDLDIAVDTRPGLDPNAFQTVDRRGRPLIVFTLSLIADARNADEIAFVLGHEAAHHILGHIPRRQQTAAQGAMLGTVFGQATGADPATLQELQRVGAEIGARRYSQNFELEADALGAEIAWRAGFDPVKGTGFFLRLPDPGDSFLGSHPPNARRKAQVAAVVAQLQSGQSM